MSREDFSIKVSGTLFGIKVNTTGPEISRILRNSGLKRNTLLKKIMGLFKERLNKRLPKLKEQLQKGVQGAKGTQWFESTSHESHGPHITIPNPLSRIVEKGMRFNLTTRKDKISVSAQFYNRRDSYINFHTKMKRVPRISTVAERLDATCLPFWSNGMADNIYKKWLEFSRIGLYYALDDFMRGINTSSKGKF